MSSLTDSGEFATLSMASAGGESPPPVPRKAQPVPVETAAGRVDIGLGRTLTIITRTWAPGDAERCRLCDRCTASARTHTCTVWTTDAVPPGAASAYSLRGRAILKVH